MIGLSGWMTLKPALVKLGTFVGSYSRVKAHLLKISGKGIKACMKVTPGHRL